MSIPVRRAYLSTGAKHTHPIFAVNRTICKCNQIIAKKPCKTPHANPDNPIRRVQG